MVQQLSTLTRYNAVDARSIIETQLFALSFTKDHTDVTVGYQAGRFGY